MNSTGQKALWVLGSFLLAGTTYLLYGNSLSGYWRYDDSAILKHAIQYSPWQYFAVPEILNRLEMFNMNPLLTATYDVDFQLGGLNPRFFYTHHLMALWLASMATAMLLRQWTEPVWAWLGGALFLLGSPLAVIAQQLMCRHYIEGLWFVSLTIFFYRQAISRNRLGYSFLSALSYFFAVSAKEIYVPVVFLLPLIAEGDYKRQVRGFWPLLLVALLYVPWRYYMLGSFLGGMGLPVDYGKALTLPYSMWEYLFGPFRLPAVCVFTFLLIRGLGRKLWNPVLAVFGIIALFAPLVPIASLVSDVDRFYVGIWWAVCLVIMIGLAEFSRHSRTTFRVALVLFAVFSTGAFIKNRQTQQRWSSVHREFDVQGRFLWSIDPQNVVILSSSVARNYWYVEDLFWLKKYVSKTALPPQICIDEIEIESALQTKKPIWQYRSGEGLMKRSEEEAQLKISEWKKRLTPRPLSIFLRYDPRLRLMEWQAGPYEQGRYLFLTSTGGLWELPRSGRLHSSSLNDFDLYLRYDSPEGWVTYSDKLRFVPLSSKPLWWQRR